MISQDEALRILKLKKAWDTTGQYWLVYAADLALEGKDPQALEDFYAIERALDRYSTFLWNSYGT